MVERPFWTSKILESLKKRPIVWLAGVRRSGKTSLCRLFPEAVYFDCELPSIRKDVEKDGFWEGYEGKLVILDEIHRLDAPAAILKIAADHHPSIRVIATGSSTLAATSKFRDTLAGRKYRIWLTPMNHEDAKNFGTTDFKKRLRFGGLPPFAIQDAWSERDYQEWLDSYWSRDIQELFQVGNRSAFLRFFELLMAQSGGIFEAGSFAKPCEVSRPTIASYLNVFETTLVAHIVRPFSKRLATEIVAAPKVYGFDTGFVHFCKGWETLSSEQCGHLFEHWVLNEFNSILQESRLQYWRDKAGHEVDFIWKRRGKPPIAIECKWQEKFFDAGGLKSFRHRHPEGENILVVADAKGRFAFKAADLAITRLGPADLKNWMEERL